MSSGVVTVAGEVDATSLDISGNADIDGTLETDNLTVGGAQGSDGQVLTSTGSGVGWEDAASSTANVTFTGLTKFDQYGSSAGHGRIEFGNSAEPYIQGIDVGNGGSGAYLKFGINATDVIYIKNDFNVGIGTTSPSAKLHVYTAGASGINIGLQNSERYWKMQTDGGFLTFNDVSAGDLARMVLDTNGKIGIGTSTPGTNHSKANNLVVGAGSAGGMAVFNGTAEGWYAFSRANANNSDAYDGGISYNGDRDLQFHTNAGSSRMTIDGQGNVGIGTQSPAALLDVGGGSIADPVILIDSAAGGDPTLRFDTGAANRSALIKFLDQGTNIGFINYKHNGDRMEFGAGSSTGVTMSVSDNWVGIGTTTRDTGTKLTLEQSGSNSNYGTNIKITNGGSHPAGVRLHSGHGNWTIYNSKTIGDCLEFADDSASKVWWTLRAGGRSEFQAAHSGDGPPGDWLFSNDDSDDGTSANTSLLVQNGNTTAQILPWTTNGVRIGTRTAGWHTTGSQNTYITSGDTVSAYAAGSNFYTSAGSLVTSDQRLKENITAIAGGQLAKINALRPVTFDWIMSGKGSDEGLIAQEVETVIPEAVGTSHFPADPSDDSRDFTDPNIKSINSSVLTARLIKAVQELSTELDAAKARITTLEG